MTQALDRPALAVRLTPMDVPLVRPWAEAEPATASGPVTAPAVVNPLMLHPGEPTEAAIAVENHSSSSLDLSIEVSGSFPGNWCQVLRSRRTLSPGQKLSAI